MRLGILKGLVTEPVETQLEATPHEVKQYSISVIGAPPLLPIEYETSIARSREFIERSEGESGDVLGVEQTSFEAGPAPWLFTALTWTQYSTPFESRVDPSEESLSSVNVVESAPLSVLFCHVAPLSVEY